MVMCLVAVLVTSVGGAAAAHAVSRPADQAEVAAAVAAAPAQGQILTYTASITNGASQNDLYDWLAGRAGTIVHLVLSISKPVAADLKARPQAITMSSKCSDPNPPSNCARSLNLSGTRYLVYGDATGLVTLANGVYNVDAYVAVSPITLDKKNIATLPLRIVVLSGPGAGEDD
jgi:hypothetical protein